MSPRSSLAFLSEDPLCDGKTSSSLSDETVVSTAMVAAASRSTATRVIRVPPPELPKPYTTFKNPDLTLTNRVASYLLPYKLPLNRVTLCPPVGKKSEQAFEMNCEMRNDTEAFYCSQVKRSLSTWRKRSRCEIGESDWDVPRPINFLANEGIAPCLPTEHIAPLTESILVKFFFPVSCLEGTRSEVTSEVTDSDCLYVELVSGGNYNNGVDVFPEGIPIVLCFHGGGMTLPGGSRTSILSNDIMMLVSQLFGSNSQTPSSSSSSLPGECATSNDDGEDEGKTNSQQQQQSNPSNFILACVEYSLAPDFPFPIAIEEALIVTQHFAQEFPNNPLHVMGSTDAGANIALVAALEEHRRKRPHTIQSCLAVCPMLDPAADSLSYYMNSKSSPVPVPWLRWCWQAYLQLPASQDSLEGDNDDSSAVDDYPDDNDLDFIFGDDPLRTNNTTIWPGAGGAKVGGETSSGGASRGEGAASNMHILRAGSNRTSWLDSSHIYDYRGSAIERLICPFTDLPSGLDAANAPEFILLTTRGDPLYDEGVSMARALERANARVTHFDKKGNHFLGSIGTSVERSSLHRLGEVWRDVMKRRTVKAVKKEYFCTE